VCLSAGPHVLASPSAIRAHEFLQLDAASSTGSSGSASDRLSLRDGLCARPWSRLSICPSIGSLTTAPSPCLPIKRFLSHSAVYLSARQPVPRLRRRPLQYLPVHHFERHLKVRLVPLLQRGSDSRSVSKSVGQAFYLTHSPPASALEVRRAICLSPSPQVHSDLELPAMPSVSHRPRRPAPLVRRQSSGPVAGSQRRVRPDDRCCESCCAVP
jgi:hypothetical protein